MGGLDVGVFVGAAGTNSDVGVAVGGLMIWVFVGEAGTTTVVDVAVGGLEVGVFVGAAVAVAAGMVEVGFRVGIDVDVAVKLGRAVIVGSAEGATAVLRVSELPVKTVTYELFLKLPPGLLYARLLI